MGKIQFIARRLAGMDYRAMRERVARVSEKTGKSRAGVLLDMARCAVRYQAGYVDYDVFGMYALTSAQRATYITRGLNTMYVRRLNDAAYYEFFHHKHKFNETFGEYLGREWLYLPDNPDKLGEFTARHPVFIAKPDDGSCGIGVERVDALSFPDTEALRAWLGERKLDLVEEQIRQHPELSALYPGAVNTVRLVTILNGGLVHIVYGCLRMGSNGGVVDNFSSGGLLSPIDMAAGTLSFPAADMNGEVYDSHPDTGTVIKGFAAPRWAECLALVRETARKIPEVRYVGWDISVTPDGPVLVEGNHFPANDLFQLPAHTPDKIGMLPAYREAAGF
ncbi:MAG: hypothetical protein LBC21_00230 [Oscillospiraceae bacterium]|jgi:glutathione synthase/RimK-type ligase-like ATP-grasp enzyme|nr:hypothetical protein [Oscillospiraceae bacterium]